MTTTNIYNMAQAWNNGAVDFTAIKMNVTDTASGSGSLLLDVQVGGSSKFKVSKSGVGTFSGGVTANSLTIDNTNGYLYGLNTGLYLRFSPTNIQLKTWANYGIITPENTNFWLYDDARVYRDAAHVLAMRNSTNGQEFRLYNTYTDASNYERGGLRWNGNVLQLVTENSGTGTQRNVQIGYATSPRLLVSQSGVSVSGNFSHSGGAFTVLTNPTFSATWNSGATVYTGITLSVTDTSSDASSLLMDLQVGGTSRLKVNKNGGTILTSPNVTDSTDLFTIIEDGNTIFNVTARDGGAMRLGSSRYLSLSADGSSRLRLGNSVGAGHVQIGAAGYISWNPNVNISSIDDLFLLRDAANTLAQRNGTNGQVFNIYNTYTDASNYERGCLKWSSNVFEVATDAAGTGSARELKLNSSSSVSIYKGATIYLDTGSYNMINMRRQTRFYATVIPHTTGIDVGSAGSSFRDLYLAPSASLSPSNNGDLCIEATNNTTLTFKYKGSDGTVRSGTIALS